MKQDIFLKSKLTIYNITGKEVIALIDNYQGAGEYSLLWDATDKFGNEVSSGVYLCELTVGKFRKSHKLILTK